MEYNKLINNASKTIAVTNTKVSEAMWGTGRKRIAMVLHNTSTAGEVISVAVGTQAASGKGIVLNQGDAYTMTKTEGYDCPQDEVNALASVATATLSIYEEVAY